MKKEIRFRLSKHITFLERELVKLRNIVSHEYLDIRWSSIKKFISETKPVYENFLDKVRRYLDKKIAESEEKE